MGRGVDLAHKGLDAACLLSGSVDANNDSSVRREPFDSSTFARYDMPNLLPEAEL